jgi:hypothetical protein
VDERLAAIRVGVFEKLSIASVIRKKITTARASRDQNEFRTSVLSENTFHIEGQYIRMLTYCKASLFAIFVLKVVDGFLSTTSSAHRIESNKKLFAKGDGEKDCICDQIPTWPQLSHFHETCVIAMG